MNTCANSIPFKFNFDPQVKGEKNVKVVGKKLQFKVIEAKKKREKNKTKVEKVKKLDDVYISKKITKRRNTACIDNETIVNK